MTEGIRFLMAAVCVTAPCALAQPTLESIREQWRAGLYAQTYEATEVFRKQPYGKRLEVYYMGGTSLCRMPGKADRGAVYMQWILDNFSLSAQDRGTVGRELRTCQDTASAVARPLAITFNTTLAVASSSGRTKMFYYDGGDNALKSVPVEVVKEIPQEELTRRLFTSGQLEQAKSSVKRLAGAGAACEASSHFVVAGAGRSPSQLRAIGRELDRVYDFFLAEYGMRAPEHLISVYLVPDAGTMRQRSLALHGIRLSPQSIGYSYQADMSMVGIVPGNQIGTLQHELFHLMVRNNFGDIPPWLDEGMAALYEVTAAGNGRVMGAPNWRGPVLQTLWSRQPSVDAMVRMNWLDFSGGDEGFDTDRQAAIHSKARYLMLYLQNEGKLRDVYRAFQSREIGDDSASLLSATLGVNLKELEVGFRTWFEKTDR